MAPVRKGSYYDGYRYMDIFTNYDGNAIIRFYYRKDGIMVDINKLKENDKIVGKSGREFIVQYVDIEHDYVLLLTDKNFPIIVFKECLEKYSHKSKRKPWTKWKRFVVTFYDPFTGNKIEITVLARNNGKTTQVMSGTLKAHSCCNEAAGDTFNDTRGFTIACQRLIIKHIERSVKEKWCKC